MDDVINLLIKKLSKLPTIGPKSATKIAYHLIKMDDNEASELAQDIKTISKKIHPCKICGSFTQEETCKFCNDDERDRTTICVVEEPQDVLTIASSEIYNGIFHVLGGSINPLEGINPSNLNFASLLERIEENNVKEIIIATNPTEEGDTTALYISHILKNNKDIVITRLASGLPIGGDIEGADKLTIARSLRSRNKFS